MFRMKIVVTVMLVTVLMSAVDAFLWPDLHSPHRRASARQPLPGNLQRNVGPSERQQAEVTSTADESDDDDDDTSEDDDERPEMTKKHGGGEPEVVIPVKLRRQFNSALGLGIDAPHAQPHTNAYDIHHSNDQMRPPWTSHYGDDDDVMYYYYYYDDDDEPYARHRRQENWAEFAYNDVPIPFQSKIHRTLHQHHDKRRIISVPRRLSRPGRVKKSVFTPENAEIRRQQTVEHQRVREAMKRS